METAGTNLNPKPLHTKSEPGTRPQNTGVLKHLDSEPCAARHIPDHQLNFHTIDLIKRTGNTRVQNYGP